jgi:hypothetical protein
MSQKTKIAKLFSNEIQHIKSVLIFNSEIITQSNAWKALKEREKKLCITPDSIVDSSNDGLCVLFNNLKQFLNNSDDYLLSYIGDEAFVEKLETLKKDLGDDIEDVLVSIFEAIEIANSDNIVRELETFDTKSEANINPIELESLPILSTIGAEYLSRKLGLFDLLNFHDLIAAKSCTESTLEMVELDELGGLLVDGLRSTFSGLFAGEVLGEGK